MPVPVPAVPPDARPLFQSMFTDRGNRAVTQTVSNLWTPAKPDAPAAANRRMLNLFSDPPPSPASRPAARSEAARAAYRIVNAVIISMVNALLSVVRLGSAVPSMWAMAVGRVR